MIHCEHCVIRTAEPDDAWDMVRLYDPMRPRSSLLGRQREIVVPTADEMREVLRPGDGRPQSFYAIEDLEGVIRGYCAARTGMGDDTHYGEAVMLLHDDADLATPLADDAWGWLEGRAFRELLWRKAVAHVLDCESAQREWLAAKGFESCGIQRDVVYTGGRWLHTETLVRYNRAVYPEMGLERDAQ